MERGEGEKGSERGEDTSQPVRHPDYYTNPLHIPPHISMAQQYREESQARQRSAASAPPRQPKPAKNGPKPSQQVKERLPSMKHHSTPSSQLPQVALPPQQLPSQQRSQWEDLGAHQERLPSHHKATPPWSMQDKILRYLRKHQEQRRATERNFKNRCGSQTSPIGAQGLTRCC